MLIQHRLLCLKLLLIRKQQLHSKLYYSLQVLQYCIYATHETRFSLRVFDTAFFTTLKGFWSLRWSDLYIYIQRFYRDDTRCYAVSLSSKFQSIIENVNFLIAIDQYNSHSIGFKLPKVINERPMRSKTTAMRAPQKYEIPTHTPTKVNEYPSPFQPRPSSGIQGLGIRNQYRYHCSHLPDNLVQITKFLASQLIQFNFRITIPIAYQLFTKDLESVQIALQFDYPEIWYWRNAKALQCPSGQIVQINFDGQDPQFVLQQNRIMRFSIQDILSKVKSSDPYEIEMDIINSFMSKLTYHKGYDLSNMSVEDATILGVFRDKQSVCQGFSLAFQLLMNEKGLNCCTCIGKSRHQYAVGLHSWNYIKLKDTWYSVDITFSVVSGIYKFINMSDTQTNVSRVALNFKGKCPDEYQNYYYKQDRMIDKYNILKLDKIILTLIDKAIQGRKQFSETLWFNIDPASIRDNMTTIKDKVSKFLNPTVKSVSLEFVDGDVLRFALEYKQ